MSILTRAKESIMSTMNLVRSNGRSGKKTEPVKRGKVVTSVVYSDNPAIDQTAKAKVEPVQTDPLCHVCATPVTTLDRHVVRLKSTGVNVIVCTECRNKAKAKKQSAQTQPEPVKTEPKPEPVKAKPVTPTPVAPVERRQAQKVNPVVDKTVNNIPVQTLVASGSTLRCDGCHLDYDGPIASFHFDGKRYCKHCWRAMSDNLDNAPRPIVKSEPAKPTPVAPVAPKTEPVKANPKNRVLPSVVCPKCKRNVPGLTSTNVCEICAKEPVKVEPVAPTTPVQAEPVKTKAQLREELRLALANLS